MSKATKVIYVDDNNDLLQTTKSFITSKIENIEFECFSAHQHLLEHIDHNDNEETIMIVDYDMPERNGVELIDLLKQKTKFKKYIIFSSHPVYEIQREIERLKLKELNIKNVDKLSATFNSLLEEINTH